MDTASTLVACVENLLDRMGIRSEVAVTEIAEQTYDVDIQSDDAPLLIGHHGQVLSSLQLVVSLMMREATGDHLRIRLNVGNYREQLEERLMELVDKKAAKVLAEDVRETLYPMNSYLRRFVHTYILEKHADIASDSIGEEPNRRVIMMKKTSNA
ncbi:hypothetical protein COW46_02080 [Candidatus Gracilibacteria bacterium CG17_big_fil_post_rev_8_21_14_2_50_48_13]|nr:MAG: hypothetical protein COW46_02080 [Candidatus Gracilibacteria bacterium CG17_big_fil_post_rev_8_21_14_2_50_48_13]